MSWQASLDAAIRNLRTEEQNLERDLERVREALRALGGLGRGAKGGAKGGAKAAVKAAAAPRRQRRLSTQGREAIARAARKRWAKWRAEQKAKG